MQSGECPRREQIGSSLPRARFLAGEVRTASWRKGRLKRSESTEIPKDPSALGTGAYTPADTLILVPTGQSSVQPGRGPGPLESDPIYFAWLQPLQAGSSCLLPPHSPPWAEVQPGTHTLPLTPQPFIMLCPVPRLSWREAHPQSPCWLVAFGVTVALWPRAMAGLLLSLRSGMGPLPLFSSPPTPL